MFSLENDVVIGTFTNSDEYYPSLLESVKKYLPNVEFILHLENKPINQNFEELRKKFIATGKRYWVFLDHDIRFLDSDIIKNALSALIRNKWALVGVYSTYYPDYVAKKEELIEKEVGWVPGYFQMVDSRYVGNVSADLELPHNCTAIDTSYCVTIRSLGYRIGIAPTYVWHQYKPLTYQYLSVIDMTNDYLRKKWGQFYFDTCVYCGCLIGSDPALELVNRGETLTNIRNVVITTELNRRLGGVTKNSDISLQVEDIIFYAKQCKHITEFGTALGDSATVFASTFPDKLISYDIVNKIDPQLVAILKKNINFSFMLCSSLEANIEETDLLFIDSLHNYIQLYSELFKHSDFVKKFILIHDTTIFGDKNEIGVGVGLNYAISDFLERHSEWEVDKICIEGNGLTILKRRTANE
ncbi:MAG: hypothetical protein WC998_06030 [Candidatus Paceibacterota bacterium]|jgi:cephalosporin hydroxylase